MHLIGLTGGVGMGKSTAAAALRARGVPVLDTDDLARELVQPGTEGLLAVVAAFGRESLLPDGTLDREWMARRVFSDADERMRLEAILHPRIAAAWSDWVRLCRVRGEQIAMVVIPLLFERGYQTGFDMVACVACSDGTQRSRLEDRGWDETEIRQRNSAQLPVGEKMERSNVVLWSEGHPDSLAAQWRLVLSRSETGGEW